MGEEVRCGLRARSRARLSHTRPAYGIHRRVGNRDAAVTEEALAATPFGRCCISRRHSAGSPAVLVVAPLSGHFATLCARRVKTLLADHDPLITHWHNARDIPLSAGVFGFEDYIDHIIQWLRVLGPGAHLLAVCQPCVQLPPSLSWRRRKTRRSRRA